MDRRVSLKGKFIAFEGIDGSGKTTQAQLLAGFLKDQGVKYRYVREPGGTQVGDKIREILLSPETVLSNWGEVLLYAAARAQIVQDVIRPALEAGEIVVCDRYLFSSLAYQGYGLMQNLELVKQVNLEAVKGLMPHLTFYLEVSPQLGPARQASQRGLDRIEMRDHLFFQRVVEGYRAMSKEFKFTTLDGSASPEEIHRQVLAAIKLN